MEPDILHHNDYRFVWQTVHFDVLQFGNNPWRVLKDLIYQRPNHLDGHTSHIKQLM